MSIEVSLQLRRGDFRLDCEFTAPGKGITALFGPSGCGKTTLLRALAGLECARGSATVNGARWQSTDGYCLPTHERGLGYVFQEASLFDHLDVAGNLAYGFRRCRNEDRRPRFDEVVDLLGIGSLLGRTTTTLSGGERQRVAIARALLSGPSLLLMDEPLSALDDAGKAGILPYLENLRDRLAIPVIYVSHTAEEVARLADHLLLMEKGRISTKGPLAQVLGDPHTPLARRADSFCVLEGKVLESDNGYGLTTVRFGSGLLHLPGFAGGVDQPIRLRVQARDISLCLDRPGRTSILNILPATVTAIDEDAESPQCLVQLDLEGLKVLARISRFSRHNLGLRRGTAVYAQIKAMALLR